MFGTDAEKLKSDVNVAWIGVISLDELLVVLRNLYIQYCNKKWEQSSAISTRNNYDLHIMAIVVHIVNNKT